MVKKYEYFMGTSKFGGDIWQMWPDLGTSRRPSAWGVSEPGVNGFEPPWTIKKQNTHLKKKHIRYR